MIEKYSLGPKQVALVGELNYAQTDFNEENCRSKNKERNSREEK
jgi:hypothetical protein